MRIQHIIRNAIAIIIILYAAKVYIDFQSKQNQRSQFCSSAKPLTEIEVKEYEANGIKLRQGTFFHKILVNNQKLSIVVFPEALSDKIWQKLPLSSIQYISSGGDADSLQEWLSPDYYYLLQVPTQATGLAFAKLCYRNGDVTVYPVNKVQKVSANKIVINDKINLANPQIIPKVNQSYVVVNAGSDRRDTPGSETEVYFTIENPVRDYQK
ncbi:MAG: hypothetical protein RMY34_26190 [Aulosira sp. DedQUE10]|nr:hypothetical protein [Aulosira sp. DedQUE10]